MLIPTIWAITSTVGAVAVYLLMRAEVRRFERERNWWKASRLRADDMLTRARQDYLRIDLELKLARRREIRPVRSEASRKGWQTRRGVAA